MRDGRYVQYFQNGRLEWLPNRPVGEQVVPGELGRLYYERFAPSPGTALNSPLTSVPLQLNAFVLNSLATAGGQQVVYVIAQKPDRSGLSGVVLSARVILPDGSAQEITPPVTDANGLSQFAFVVPQLAVQDLVRIEVSARLAADYANTSAWFRIWY